MNETNGHIVVDQSSFTLRELAAIDEMTGGGFGDATKPGTAPRLMAAFAAVVKQRDDPTFTYDDALDLPPSSIELVGAAPEVFGDDGMTPPSSPESGTLTRST